MARIPGIACDAGAEAIAEDPSSRIPGRVVRPTEDRPGLDHCVHTRRGKRPFNCQRIVREPRSIE